MKVEINIINTGCILTSEAVTIPSLMMMPVIISEESACQGQAQQTDRHTDTAWSMVTFSALLTTSRWVDLVMISDFSAFCRLKSSRWRLKEKKTKKKEKKKMKRERKKNRTKTEKKREKKRKMKKKRKNRKGRKKKKRRRRKG